MAVIADVGRFAAQALALDDLTHMIAKCYKISQSDAARRCADIMAIVENPKSVRLLIVLYCIVLYCIILYCTLGFCLCRGMG